MKKRRELRKAEGEGQDSQIGQAYNQSMQI